MQRGPARPISLLTGALGGAIGGLTGVGGSAFMIPLMMRRGGMPAHLAHGTALAVVVAVAIAGSVTYIANGLVEWDLVGSLLAGSLIGAYLGAALAVRLSAARLQFVFALFFMGVAIRMLVA